MNYIANYSTCVTALTCTCELIFSLLILIFVLNNCFLVYFPLGIKQSSYFLIVIFIVWYAALLSKVCLYILDSEKELEILSHDVGPHSVQCHFLLVFYL